MSKRIDISIIIVSSKIDFLSTCLDSLSFALSELKWEIILVDNASKDRIDKFISAKYPYVKVLRREDNGGFGENNNMGMRIAKGKYILLLNDDTKIIDKKIFTEMVAWMDKHPKVGLSSCGLVNPDEITFQGSGGYFPTLPRVFAWMTFFDDIPFLGNLIKSYHPMHPNFSFNKNEKYFKVTHKQDWVTGAFFLVRKEVIEQVGFFDEDFFLYVEEVDLAYRITKAGWEVWYLPRWKTVHFGMSTNGSENATIMEMQNLQLFYKKHMPNWEIIPLKILIYVGVILRIILYTATLNFKVVKIYIKALLKV